MADDEPQCKVEYIDNPDAPEETNWIKRAGKAKVTYVNGCTFEGTFDSERIKQGQGVYVWMTPGGEEDDTPVEKARYEGNYKDGLRSAVGRMVYPNGDIYEGEWLENKMHGEGSYIYKKTGDIYSGSWENNKKQGKGRYECAADSSVLCGAWVDGQITEGSWEWKDAGKYDGTFKLGRPVGTGRFEFVNGIVHNGEYAIKKPAEGEEEEPVEGEGPRPPEVSWKGQSIVSC